ncbi:MAG TPA: hypothetical protein VFE60_11560 [Roseiarcus sp.]|jgi:hypothetical protein|nr:hypothetical protein [Roseiarcus sp.]
MKANGVRFAACLAVVAFATPFPACGQFIYPPLVIVPPPAQDYATPKPGLKPPSPKPKPQTDTPPPAKSTGHYQGQTFVPD